MPVFAPSEHCSLQTPVRCGGFVFIAVDNLPKEYKGYIYVITGPDCFKEPDAEIL